MLVLIDNYDSFTYNLVHYFEELGEKVSVIRNDEKSSREILKISPDYIVISPGPSNPRNAGICIDLIKENSSLHRPIPMLGVCLGHQAIGEAFGAKIKKSGNPVHGKVSGIIHKNSSIFKNVDNPFNATRYHSLIIDRALFPNCFNITAETNDKTIMGIEHKELPLVGVQFHPESIATDNGHLLLRKFLDNFKR